VVKGFHLLDSLQPWTLLQGFELSLRFERLL
jgi:hypothetical protein